MDKQTKDKLRHLRIDLLSFLHTLAVTGAVALELNEISDSTSTAESELKGQISTLRRMKFPDEPIIVPAGRDQDGRLRWKINEEIVNKKELAEFLENEILGK